MPKYPVWAGAAIAAMLLAIVVFMVLSPGFAVSQVQDYAERVLGRSLAVAGGAHLEFTPQLAIRLDGVTVSNPPGMDGLILSARSLRLPLRFADLVQRRAGAGPVTLVEPRFNFHIDDRGRANWAGPGDLPIARLALANAQVSYLDMRNGQSAQFGEINAAADVSSGGEFSLQGNAVLKGAFIRFQAYVKSPARIAGGGSPLDFTLDAPALKASFNGRLAADPALSLAGQIRLSGDDLRRTLRWAGSTIGGSRGFKSFTLAGSLDSKGEAFTVDTAEVSVDGLAAKGRVGFNLGARTPLLFAALVTARFDADHYLEPPPPGGWDERPLGFEKLPGLDAQFSLAADQFSVRGLALGPAKLTGHLAAGRFAAQLEADRLKAVVAFDAEGASLELDTQRPLFGWLAGASSLSLKAAGSGRSEQQIVSTLKGEAHISATGGSLRGIDVRGIATSVGRAVLDGWPKGGFTPFDRAEAQFAIADGIATVTKMALNSAALRMTGKGEVDLLRRALDLKFDPRLVSGGASSPALPVAIAVRGPWAAPKIFPDLPDILIDPESAYLALKAMDMTAAGSN